MTLSIKDLSPAFSQRVDDLRTIVRTDTPYKLYVERALDGLQSDYVNMPDMMNFLLEAQRLLTLHLAGLEADEELLAFYQSNDVRSYYQYKSPAVEPELIQSLGDKIYNMRDGHADYGMVQTDDGVRSVAEAITRKLIEQKQPFDIQFRDTKFKNTVFNKADEAGLQRLADYHIRLWEPVTRRMVVVPGLPSEDAPEIEVQKNKFYTAATKRVHDRLMSGEIHFTLTSVPTRRDADFDAIPYEDYLTLFFEMCDQPWDHIDTAHKVLIDTLKRGKILRFTNNDGTDISMDIEGFTFANSLIARNVPGSEVFSAPKRDSVNGRIVAKGHFSPPGRKGARIEDITLVFRDGKCVEYSAALGDDVLKELVETDENSCYVGEIGIGTNPYLRRQVGNIGLVEKISGSFHIALGDAYTMTDYMGTPVKVDNGNRSHLHWDIVTMLHGKGGVMTLDGDVISKDGLFLDPALSVLNLGWEAVPRDSRPDYWKDYDFARRPGLPPQGD